MKAKDLIKFCSESSLSSKLKAVLQKMRLNDVDINDQATIKVLNDYESDIIDDPKTAELVMNGDFYGHPPQGWLNFYMDLADVMGWDTSDF